jgi:hypothetical protein
MVVYLEHQQTNLGSIMIVGNNQRYIFDNSKYTSPQEAFIALREDILSIIETGGQFHLTKNLNILKSLDQSSIFIDI